MTNLRSGVVDEGQGQVLSRGVPTFSLDTWLSSNQEKAGFIKPGEKPEGFSGLYLLRSSEGLTLPGCHRIRVSLTLRERESKA